jgi:hypothetical protein
VFTLGEAVLPIEIILFRALGAHACGSVCVSVKVCVRSVYVVCVHVAVCVCVCGYQCCPVV